MENRERLRPAQFIAAMQSQSGLPNSVGFRPARWTAVLIAVFGLLQFAPASVRAQPDRENAFYKLVTITTSQAATESRSKFWKPAPEELVLEVSGLAPMDDGRLAVSIRKGEIWFLDQVYEDPPLNVTYHRFATALHEPLGLLARDKSLYTVQRTELTRLQDTDDDDVADVYETVAKGWGVTGNYHEYAFGPKLDGQGNMWLTLNLGLGIKGPQKTRTIRNEQLKVAQGRWRGWGMKVKEDGTLEPVCAGMRSPSGLGANREGDMFYTDQQGNWVPTNSLHHMRRGAFFHHPEALASIAEPGSPLTPIETIPNGLPYPQAVEALPQLQPPAVWLPYKKVGQSATDIVLCEQEGRFGPFDGQLFVGEFTLSSISRVYLEKVGGEYQGACFPFREGLASAVLRMAFGKDGSMFAGLSNRGWSSVGTAAYGLQRLVWTGKTPFEIKEMRAAPDGFVLEFTQPVDRASAASADSYALSSFTYNYHQTYGSDEILTRQLKIRAIDVSQDGRTVRLRTDGLRALFVHQLIADGIRSADGEPLLHPDAYYTLNRIPKN